jgi:hypothetical protein
MSAGLPSQDDGQVVALNDGGYVVVWTDFSRTYNPAGAAVIGQRYDSSGNKVGGEVKLSGFNSGDQFSPAVTRLDNGNIAVAFVDQFAGDRDIWVSTFNSSLNLVRTDFIDVSANQRSTRRSPPSPTAATCSPTRWGPPPRSSRAS